MTYSSEKFDRSVCFTFFAEHLSRIEAAERKYGKEAACDLALAIARYALFQEEPSDASTRSLLEPIKGGIDANQAKRRERFEQFNRI